MTVHVTPWGSYELVRTGVYRNLERAQSYWVVQVCGPLPGTKRPSDGDMGIGMLDPGWGAETEILAKKAEAPNPAPAEFVVQAALPVAIPESGQLSMFGSFVAKPDPKFRTLTMEVSRGPVSEAPTAVPVPGYDHLRVRDNVVSKRKTDKDHQASADVPARLPQGLSEVPPALQPEEPAGVRRAPAEPAEVSKIALPSSTRHVVDHTANWLAELAVFCDAHPTIHAGLTLGGQRHGCMIARVGDVCDPIWIACLTRIPDTMESHVSYLYDPSEKRRGFALCPACADAFDYGEAPIAAQEPPLCIVPPPQVVWIFADFPEGATDVAVRVSDATVLPSGVGGDRPDDLVPVASGCCPSFAVGRGIHDPRCKIGGYGYTPRTQAAWDEEFGERAAILEFMGGYSRTVAEMRAREMIGGRP